MISRYCALLILMMVALAAACGLARAGTGIDADTDPSVIVEHHVRHYIVEPDGTYRLTVDDVRTIAGLRAVRDQVELPIHYGATSDEIVSVDACTQKPDGRRIHVPPDAIRDQAIGAAAEAHAPAGTRTKTVVYPDVAIGDRLLVHYVVRRRTPPFPGQFEDLAVMPFHAHGNTMLIYDMPAAMPLHADAVGFVPTPGDSPPGRRRYQWHYVTGGNDRTEPGAVSVLDDGRRLAVSTFADYPAFAAALRAAAAGKALPSPAIAALARQLTAGLPDTRARVLALADWVRHNIRHADGGGAVPHPAGTVLDTRRGAGDGNDHAALLEALLAAVDIASTPALVNGGSAYKLPGVPTLGVLDHAILYVPALDLFVDPAGSVKAGYLPPALLGKPVLLLKSGTFAMTPVLQPQTVRTVATVDIGRGTFTVDRTVSGALVEPVRTMAHAIATVGREPGAASTPQNVRQTRSGIRVADASGGAGDDGDGHGETYTMTLSGEDIGGQRTDAMLATTYRAWSAVDAAVASLLPEHERRRDFVCAAIDAEDETRLRLPQGVRVVSLPGPASVVSGGIFYRATYTRESDAVVIKRRLTFRHGRATCTPDDDRAMRPALERIRRDLRNRIAGRRIAGRRVAGRRIAGRRIAVTAGASTTRPASASGMGAATERITPPARAQPGHGLVREVEAQVDTVAARAVAAGPAGDLDKTAAPEKAGRVRMGIDRHIAGSQLAAGHVQQAVGQQRATDPGTVAVGTHEAEHEGAQVIKLGQFVAAETDDLAGLDGDEQRTVRVVQGGAQP
jgi:transglutaminase-like putative cysteine protease